LAGNSKESGKEPIFYWASKCTGNSIVKLCLDEAWSMYYKTLRIINLLKIDVFQSTFAGLDKHTRLLRNPQISNIRIVQAPFGGSVTDNDKHSCLLCLWYGINDART